MGANQRHNGHDAGNGHRSDARCGAREEHRWATRTRRSARRSSVVASAPLAAASAASSAAVCIRGGGAGGGAGGAGGPHVQATATPSVSDSCFRPQLQASALHPAGRTSSALAGSAAAGSAPANGPNDAAAAPRAVAAAPHAAAPPPLLRLAEGADRGLASRTGGPADAAAAAAAQGSSASMASLA